MPRPMSASMFDLSGAGPLDALSVDEQLDLEQQAEFFIAIGQEEAAIELLQPALGVSRDKSGRMMFEDWLLLM